VRVAPELVYEVIGAVESLSRRYEISALKDFLESIRSFAQDKTLNVPVFGRFKAGKSSFLNHILGRPLLPVGAIPVTSVVGD
jgi:predicted GTPase